MLIGTSKISNGLERHIDSYEDFMEYAKSLVPQEYRHNTALIHNQAYFNAMTLRKATYIPWEKKKELLETVMKSITVSGYTDVIIDIDAIYDYVDNKRVDKFWRKLNG